LRDNARHEDDIEETVTYENAPEGWDGFEAHCAMAECCAEPRHDNKGALIGTFLADREDTYGREYEVAEWRGVWRIDGTDLVVCEDCCGNISDGSLDPITREYSEVTA
jgi:hypothetical protein